MQRRKFIISSILTLLSTLFVLKDNLFINNKENESMIRTKKVVKRAKEIIRRTEKYCDSERVEVLQMARSVRVPENIYAEYSNFKSLISGYNKI